METVACLRSKCHLKQNLISRFRCKTKYTNKQICRTPGPAYLAVLPVLVIFCPLGPTVRRILKSLNYLLYYYVFNHVFLKNIYTVKLALIGHLV